MSELRICHVTALPQKDARGPVGGVGTYSLALLDLLSAGPFEQSVACNDDAEVGALALPEGTDVRTSWTFGSARYPSQIARSVDGLRPDVVHVQQELFLYGPGPIALLFPLMLARLRKRHRIVVTVHGVTTDREIDASLMQGRRSPIPLPLLRAVIVGIFRSIARSGADLVVHGEVLKERLVALGARPERVTVIAHPLFTTASQNLQPESRAQARAALGLPLDAKIALTWGYWNGYKGVDVLAGGFARFALREPNAMLLLGTGPHPQLRNDSPYMSAYASEMTALSASDGVRHVGFIADADLPRYVRAADVCVFAYTKYLAASGPATFALTMDAPVLFSSVFTDVPAALAFEPTPAGVDDALVRFFADPQTAADATRTLRERASNATLLERYGELYRRVAAE